MMRLVSQSTARRAWFWVQFPLLTLTMPPDGVPSTLKNRNSTSVSALPEYTRPQAATNFRVNGLKTMSLGISYEPSDARNALPTRAPPVPVKLTRWIHALGGPSNCLPRSVAYITKNTSSAVSFEYATMGSFA